ncbi:hypothetical protein CBS101457_004831 [Exobasidium rhododendri]|nr:hypothetical protein CBS101457_004831 [Exobasidium rhododendri]
MLDTALTSSQSNHFGPTGSSWQVVPEQNEESAVAVAQAVAMLKDEEEVLEELVVVEVTLLVLVRGEEPEVDDRG